MKYNSKTMASKNSRRATPDLTVGGGCNDSVTCEFKTAVAGGTAPDEQRHDADDLVDFALMSDDMIAVAGTLKELELRLPLSPDQEKAIDRRTLALIADGTARNCPDLAGAIAAFVYQRARNNPGAARPLIPALLSFLNNEISTTCASSYYTLIIVAINRPEDLEPHASSLIAMLASPRDTTKAFAIKIIATLASEHPEYVAGSEKTLERLSRDHPQPIVREISADACRVLHRNQDPGDTGGQVEVCHGDLQVMPADPGNTGNSQSLNEKPDHLSMSRIGNGINAVIAIVSDKVDELINLKMHVNLSIVGRRSDNEEMREVLGHFSAIAPWVKDEFRSPGEPTDGVELSPSYDATTGPMPSETLTKKMVQDAFRKDTFKFALPIEAAAMADAASPVLTAQALDEAHVVELQRIMEEVEHDFSISAGDILSTIGLEHLKPGSSLTAESGNRQISAREFIAAVETIVQERNCNQLKQVKPQEPGCAGDTEELISYHQ